MKKIKILNVLILAITLNFAHFVADATAKDENKQKVEEVKTTEKTESENKSEGKVEGKNAGNNIEKFEEVKAQVKTKRDVEKSEKLEEEWVKRKSLTTE